jgi:hypothetical protein
MRALLATFFVAFVLSLVGAASARSAGADPGAPAAGLTATSAPTAVVCTPAWGTIVLPVCF